MSRRRRYRSSGSGSGSPWWISGVYAVGLGIALFVILSVSGNSDTPGFMHQMFFEGSSDGADASDATNSAADAVPHGSERMDDPARNIEAQGGARLAAEPSSEAPPAADSGETPQDLADDATAGSDEAVEEAPANDVRD